MKKLLITSLFLGSCVLLPAQKTTKIPNVYKPVRSEMYKKGWIDFNKMVLKIPTKIRQHLSMHV